MTTATANINQVNLVGRLGKDPEIRYFESGTVITKLTLAVNRRNRDENPDWFDIEMWGKTAEIAANYTQKGSLIGIEGELKLDEWQDRNTGLPRSKPVIKANRLELLSSPNNSDNSNNHSAPKSSQPKHDDDDF
ncbi:MAG: single-stranded DNA-binding protein [Cyanobacteria bacterium P01_G01_bin.49]